MIEIIDVREATPEEIREHEEKEAKPTWRDVMLEKPLKGHAHD